MVRTSSNSCWECKGPLIAAGRNNVKHLGMSRWLCGYCVRSNRNKAENERRRAKAARQAHHNSIGDLF